MAFVFFWTAIINANHRADRIRSQRAYHIPYLVSKKKVFNWKAMATKKRLVRLKDPFYASPLFYPQKAVLGVTFFFLPVVVRLIRSFLSFNHQADRHFSPASAAWQLNQWAGLKENIFYGLAVVLALSLTIAMLKGMIWDTLCQFKGQPVDAGFFLASKQR